MPELSAVANDHNLLFPLMHRYTGVYPDEAGKLAPLIEQMFNGLEIYDRSALPGHITASGLVVQGGKILLIFHPFLQMWLQPGGHVDAGESPLQAAQRELLEETGMRSTVHRWHRTQAIPFDIDIHTIPPNPQKNEPAHLHYDFRYLLHVDAANPGQPLETDHPMQWRDLRDMGMSDFKRVVDKLAAQGLL